MLDKILLKLAALIFTQIIEHWDELAAPIATAVTREILAALPLKAINDVADLPAELAKEIGQSISDVFNKVPIFGGLFNGFLGNK